MFAILAEQLGLGVQGEDLPQQQRSPLFSACCSVSDQSVCMLSVISPSLTWLYNTEKR